MNCPLCGTKGTPVQVVKKVYSSWGEACGEYMQAWFCPKDGNLFTAPEIMEGQPT